MIPDGPDCKVIVRFQPKVAQNVAQVAWHKTQRITRNADGTLDFHVTVSWFHEMSWWILGNGNQAEVLEPAELRELNRDHAEQMVQQYGRTPAPELA